MRSKRQFLGVLGAGTAAVGGGVRLLALCRKPVACVVSVTMLAVPCLGNVLQARSAEAQAQARHRVEAAQHAKVAAMRQQVKEALATAGSDTRQRDRMQRMLSLLDIASATSASERHRLIGKLPVKIVETAGGKEFWAGGKLRFRVTPAAHVDQHGFGGPSLNGEQDECAPDTCATVQDGEDAIALAADLQADIDEMQAWLDEHPLEADSGGDEGPNAPEEEMNCAAHYVAAGVDLGLAVLGRVALYSLGAELAGGAVVATGTVAMVAFTAVFSVGAAALAIGLAVACYQGRNEPDPAPSTLSGAVEERYVRIV